MPVTAQKRTVVAIFGTKDRAENAIAELLKLGISRERISPEAGLSSEIADVYLEDVRRGAILVSVSANSEGEANEVRDLLDRYNLPDSGQVTGHNPGAEHLSADEKLRQGNVVDQGEPLQASRRTRIFAG